MKTKIFNLIMLASISLFFIACDNGNSNSNSQKKEVSVKFDYNLAAKHIGEQNVNRSAQRNSDPLFTGKLKVYDVLQPSVPPKEFNWYANLSIDSDDYNGTSNKTIVLKEGTYQFELLLQDSLGRKYASSETLSITNVEAKNGDNIKKTLTLKPIIEDKEYTLDEANLTSLSNAKIDFFDKKTRQDMRDKFGEGETEITIAVDDEKAKEFKFNPANEKDEIFLNLPPGEHNLSLKFKSSNGVMGRSLHDPMKINIKAGETTVIPMVPYHAEGSFNFEINSTDVNVTFRVPADLIKNNGGVDKVKATINGKETQINCPDDMTGYCTITRPIKSGGKDGSDDASLKLYKDSDGDGKINDEFAGGKRENIGSDSDNNVTIPLMSPEVGHAVSGLFSVIGINVYLEDVHTPVGEAPVYVNGNFQGNTAADYSIHTKGFYKGYIKGGNHTLTSHIEIDGEVYKGKTYVENAEDFGVENYDIILKKVTNPDAFKMTVKIDSTDLQFAFTLSPLHGYLYKYNLDCGNGKGTVLVESKNYTCKYDEAGKYQITIDENVVGGFFPLYFNTVINENKEYTYPENEKIISVDQWGTIKWTDISYAFAHAKNMELLAHDKPDLSRASGMVGTFWETGKFNQNINHWDVSNITNFSYAFKNSKAYNQPIEQWKFNRQVTLYDMFNGAEEFNQPLNNLDTSNVVSVAGIFANTKKFNQPINDWNTSNMTNISYTFAHSTAFNQPLDKWDVSKVNTFQGTFFGAQKFNQPLKDWKLDFTLITSIQEMFRNTKEFFQDLSSWDITNSKPELKSGKMFENSKMENKTEWHPKGYVK